LMTSHTSPTRSSGQPRCAGAGDGLGSGVRRDAWTHNQRTLARWCRTRSYLDSAVAHGLTALEAVTAARTGKPWLPLPAVPAAA
jgi:hypothetical protein